jgi:hypothetical protein
MNLKTFNWNNGTQSSPIVLTNDQIKKLIAIGQTEGLDTSVKGCVTTSSRKMQKFLKYALEKQFPDLNIICDEELADSFKITTNESEIKEGTSNIINIATDSGISHDFLKWKYEFSDFVIDGDISEDNIKSRIRVEDGYLIIDDPKENASWTCTLKLTAYPVYYDESDFDNIPTVSKPDVILTIKAKKIEDITITTSAEVPINSEVDINVAPYPTDSTKLKGARYTYSTNTPDLVSISTSSSGTTIKAKAQGTGTIVVTLYACNNTVTLNNTVSFSIYDLKPVRFVIDQRYLGVSDPTGMVSENCILDSNNKLQSISDSGSVGDSSTNTLTWFREHTHAYVGRFTGFSGMRLKQLSPTTRKMFNDGTSAIGYIDNENGEYDVWMKCDADIYYKTEPWTPVGLTEVDENYVLVTIAREIPSNETSDIWQVWSKNSLIGVHKACMINNKLYSLSGKTAVNNISQTNAKSRARARGTGFRLVTYEASTILALLFYGYYSSLDSQSVVGYGTANVVSSTYYPKVTGATDELGERDTTYEEGTGASSPDSDQIKAGEGSDIKSNQFWIIENIQGDLSEWIDNLMVMQAKRPSSVTTANPSIYLSDYVASYGYPIITKQGVDYQLTAELLEAMSESQRFVVVFDINRNVSRIIQHGSYTANSEGYIKRMCFGAHADILAKEFGGSSDTGFCDYGSVYSAGSVARRSNSSANPGGGVGYLRLSDAAGDAFSYISSRLQYDGTEDTIHVIDDATETL